MWAGTAQFLIDQEGGRVQRLRPPHWTDYPPAATYKDNQDFISKRYERLGAGTC